MRINETVRPLRELGEFERALRLNGFARLRANWQVNPERGQCVRARCGSHCHRGEVVVALW